MHLLRRVLSLAAIALVLPSTAHAADVTVTDGDGSATVDTTGSLIDLRVIGTTDDVFRSTWSYRRVGGDPVKRRIDGTPTATGRQVTVMDTLGGGAQATILGTLTDLGPTGYWTSALTVTNTEPVQRTYDLYFFVDLDIAASDTVTLDGDGLRQTGSDGTYYTFIGTSPFGRYGGPNTTEDTSATLDYTTDPVASGSGDRAMLLQFRVAIPAGASRTVTARLAGNMVAPSLTAPSVTIARPVGGERIGLGRAVPLDVSCENATTCSAIVDGTPIADGDPLPTTEPGDHLVLATAKTGATTVTRAATYTVVDPVISLGVTGSGVLTDGGETFTPGPTDRTYTTSLTATVSSDAGPSTLTVRDLGPNPGYLLHPTAGPLLNPLEARVGGAIFQAIGADPLTLTSLTAPVTGPQTQSTTVDLRQRISGGEALRSGTYGKTLTFTALGTGSGP